MRLVLHFVLGLRKLVGFADLPSTMQTRLATALKKLRVRCLFVYFVVRVVCCRQSSGTKDAARSTTGVLELFLCV